MPARDEGAAHTGAGVRKPPGKEPARGGQRRCRGRYGDLAAAARVAVMGSRAQALSIAAVGERCLGRLRHR